MKNLYTKNLFLKFLVGIVFFTFSHKAIAQIEVEPTGALFSPESLITNVFLGEGVEVTNLTFNGSEQAVGYFTNGLNDIGIDRGIIMSSGFAITAATANTAGGTTGSTTGPGVDADLNPIASGGLNDIVWYEISFIPTSDTLQFKYVFASEEYPEYACSPFNDVFGFFMTGPNPSGGNYTGENIALVPDPADPSGLTFTNIPVTINNVNNQGVNPGAGCNFDYSVYYNDNSGSMTLTYDAYLDVFIAQAIVIPCEEYTIKLALADVGDGAFDTGVFLEAKSFGTGALDVEISSLSLDGTIAEGCASAVLTFALPSLTEADYPIDYTIFGTAENGVDYEQIPSDLYIPQGENSVSVDIIAYGDGIDEGIESIGIDVQRDPCTRDTFWLFIKDNSIVPPQLGPDTTICQEDSVQLNGTLPIPLPDPPIFSNETIYPIVTISNNNPPPPGTPPTLSEIQVFGVQPATLQEGVIKRVCIDIDHNWISDVDVFLLGPNGQFLELTTDNGGSGDDYTGTCFTPVATNDIDFGSQAPPSAAPFTGDWQPEGSWEDLWTIQDPQTNGIWTLQVKDDQTGFEGTLEGWSICFNPLYQLDYEWTPTEGLSCSDCREPVASPDTTTTYYLTVTDTYGCSVKDTITINVNIIPQLQAPDVSCGNITDNSIEFCWDPLPGVNDYEVNVDGMGWMSSNNNLCYNVTGLTLEDTVTIQVAGIYDCSGIIDTLTCWTPACTPPDGSILSQTPTDCFGDSTGMVTVEAVGINPPFEFFIAGIDTNSTGFFDGLPAGDYTVLVLDAVNCPQSVPITIDEPDEIVTTEVLINNAACNGGTDGSITVSVTGGNAPYSFIWSNAQTDSIANNLPIGEYYVTVSDANGCLTLDTVNVVQPPVMSLTTSTDSVSCNSAGDGTATVMVNGGVGPYTYQWDANTSNQTDSIAFGLDGGTYTVTVTDQNNCTTETDVTVIENDAIMLTTSGTDISCFNGDDGTATVIAAGGTGSYTYEWSDPGMQSTATASDLQVGTVTVLVTDTDGCFATADVILNQPNALSVSSQFTDAFCNGSNDGVITIITNGGTLPYNYEWSDTPLISDSSRTDLIAGDYMITVTDDNGCSEILDVTIGEPDAIDLTFNTENVNCNGENDGSATVIVNGGVGPYNYQWDANANNQTTPLAAGLSAGSYTLTVTDDNNCTSVSTIDILEPDVLSLSNSSEDVLCFGNSTGSIDLTITGGTTPYDIVWTGPGFSSSQEDISNLISGIYEVEVTDENSCTASLSVNIIQPATGIMSTISDPDSICFEDGNGTLSVNVGGGTGPFTYDWSNGAASSIISNLDGGMYIITITDSGNCTFIDTSFVFEESEITVNLSQSGSLCHDGVDGTATIDAIFVGNTNTAITGFEILWSTGGQTSEMISGLTGGQTYSVTVTNAMGCTSSQSIEIGNPEEIEASITDVTDTRCYQGEDGSSTVAGIGGIAPYSFQWDAAADDQTTATANDLSPGIYFVTVTDNNGCSTTISTEVGEAARLTLDFDTDGTDCYNDPTGSATANVEGGTPGYNYLWSNGGTSSGIDSVVGGNYELTVTDVNGCSIIEEAIISQPEPLDAQIDVSDISCFGGRDGELIFFPEGGTAPFTYSLDGIDYNGSDLQIALTAGTYGAYIRDSKGCESYIGDYTISEPEILIVDLGERIIIQYGETAILNPIVTGGTGSYTFIYNSIDSTTISCLQCSNPIVSPEYATSYGVLVTDENGCTAEANVLVIVEKDWPVYVPTGFSPNNDGINDILLVHGTRISTITVFRVYDRWGEMVYEDLDFPYDANNQTRGWDGKFREEEMNPGVFVWFVEVEYEDGTTATFQGNTTLIR